MFYWSRSRRTRPPLSLLPRDESLGLLLLGGGGGGELARLPPSLEPLLRPELRSRVEDPRLLPPSSRCPRSRVLLPLLLLPRSRVLSPESRG